MEVRRLNTGDFFKISTIIGKMALDGIKDMKDANPSQIGLIFISKALKFAESDLRSWMATLIGVSADDFDNLGFEAPIEIIEKLGEQEDLPAFFSRASKLVTLFRK